MSEKLYEACRHVGTFAAQIGDALAGIITKTRKSADATFWTSAAEASKAKAHKEAHQQCEKIVQGTAELKQKLYPQLGQAPQESATTDIGFSK